MVNVWKIGPWPGFPNDNPSKTNKEEFINKHALQKNYVAIGFYDWKAGNKSEEQIRKEYRNESSDDINSFIYFTRKIDRYDIVLLYHDSQVYVGKVKRRKPHYEVKDEPRHRIGVEWLYNQRPIKADFKKGWASPVRQIKKADLFRIKDQQLRSFLKRQMKNNKPVEQGAKIEKTKINIPTKALKSEQNSYSYLKDTERIVTKQHNKMINKFRKIMGDRPNIKYDTGYMDIVFLKWKNDRNLIIEAKTASFGNTGRTQIRQAIGQLFDYRYTNFKKYIKKTDLAILLTKRPNKEIKKLLELLEIELLWFENDRLEGTIARLVK